MKNTQKQRQKRQIHCKMKCPYLKPYMIISPSWTGNRKYYIHGFELKRTIAKVCNHVIAVYREEKLQHYTTAYRNHKSADEKLGIFRFCKFFIYIFFSAYTLQPVQKSLFNWIATRLDCSWQAVAYVWNWKSLNLCCLSKLFDIFNIYQTK